MKAHPITGSCLCGAVRYETQAPTLFCSHCHCDYCRRAHGAAFVTWFGVNESGLKLRSRAPESGTDGSTSGEDHLVWYQSSPQSRRGFCNVCGSTLFFMSQLCPGEVHVALATATTQIDREPEFDCFFEQHVAWGRSETALHQLRGDGEELGRYRQVPKAPTPQND